MSGFDSEAARRAGMPEHHIEWSEKLTAAREAVEADDSPENRAALDDLSRQVQAARQYEREEAAGVPPERRLSVQRRDGTVEWHSTVADEHRNTDTATPRPEGLPPPGDATASPASVDASTDATGS